MRWDAPNAPDNWSEVDDFIKNASYTHYTTDFWGRRTYYCNPNFWDRVADNLDARFKRCSWVAVIMFIGLLVWYF